MPDLTTAAYVMDLMGQTQPDPTTPDGAQIIAQLAALVTAASASFLSMTNRKTIAPASFTETRSGDGTGTLILRESPIISIVALSMNGRLQSAWTPAGRFGYVLADDGFTVEMIGSGFAPGMRNIVITYTAGYSPIPADIAQAVAEMVLWKRAKMPRIDQVSGSLNGMETVSFDRSSIPPFARDTVAQYLSLGGFRSGSR